MEVFIKLKKKRTIRRIFEGAITVLSLIALITFNVLKENSKIIEKIEVTPFLSYDRVQYTEDYSVAIMIFGLIFALFVSALVADFIATRIYYREIDGEDIIVYNGMGWIKLLVNGEKKDAMFFKGYLETKLKTGVTMLVSPQFFMSYHITFSDNRPAIDL
ncbi:MAG: hypothetical protein MJ070_09505 [Lachnospiraceae bacterium]|nr:hypothetical protein [Lachnospiraceae bacterium]